MYLTLRRSERVRLDLLPSPLDSCVAGKKRLGKDDDNDYSNWEELPLSPLSSSWLGGFRPDEYKVLVFAQQS